MAYTNCFIYEIHNITILVVNHYRILADVFCLLLSYCVQLQKISTLEGRAPVQ